MKLQSILFFLFAFSFAMVAINSMGIFGSQDMPHQNLNTTEAQITDLTTTSQTESGGWYDSLTGGARLIFISIETVIGAVKSAFTLPQMLRDYGIPQAIINMLYGMFLLIALFGILKWWTGRSDKGMS